MFLRCNHIISCLSFLYFLACASCLAQDKNPWPDTMPWWKANNLRLIQTNLPAYEASLNVDHLIADLERFSANVLLINAGGIMAFYPSKLDFQYINPHMRENMLRDVIEKCHERGIRVIVRFDFSRAHESIYERHPEWFYLSPKGERIVNDDMVMISINAPYLQEKSIKIVEEVIDNYTIDGIFINMPGYSTQNHYTGTYHGIDQNEYDKRRFAEYSGGMKLPLVEDENDPVFQTYIKFKDFTGIDWRKRMHQMVKSKDEHIAICTYRTQYVDIIRHESLTKELPYWPYQASDNVNNLVNSYPNHIASNASIQQISFQSRYNAVEPEEVAIRLYENLAQGSGLDISLMGDFRDYEDQRNFDVIREIYAHHKNYEKYYGRYTSISEVAVISPGYWPGGDAMQEYRGIQLMLNEAHVPYDIIEDSQIANLGDKLLGYRVIILPEIRRLSQDTLNTLRRAIKGGTHIVATNRSFSENPRALKSLFGAEAVKAEHDGSGNYLSPVNKNVWKRFQQQSMLFWQFNLGIYQLNDADEKYLPILAKGRTGPPEKIGGHDFTGHYAMSVKHHGAAKAVLLPMNIGKLYYLRGYEQHKNLLLDVLDYLYPDVGSLIKTNAHPRVETVFKKFIYNSPKNINAHEHDGMVLHLINLTGFSGNSYFEPLPVHNIEFDLKMEFMPKKVFALGNNASIPFIWDKGRITFTVNQLGKFQTIVFER